MHDIEPYHNWRHLYLSEEDVRSPFFDRTYDEFAFTRTIYNYYIHPQWDDFGSRTLYLKILFADYETGYAILELIGEWNDAIENDIMTLKREVVDCLLVQGIRRFILVAENVLNFHSSDASYYEEWLDDIREEHGWVVILNMPEASQQDFRKSRLTRYVDLLEFDLWRTLQPSFLLAAIDDMMPRRLGNE
ncbi:MAG: hypothetical protein FJX89_10985 [Bacteroidetes bacterium]|nr:hypothetical protein [Bacteroidota bacterium]